MTFKTTMIAAGALIAASAATVPAAQADSVRFNLQFGTPNATIQFGTPHRGPRWQRHKLSPQDARRVLRNQGFRNIRFLDRRGSVYVARAVAYNGRPYTVRVNAYSGRIVAQYAVDRRGRDRDFDRGGRRGGWRY